MSGRTKGYKVTPETDMTGFGMAKVLNWRTVDYDGTNWRVKTFQLEAVSYPCKKCGSEYIWLSPQRTGVYRVCLGCKTTSGPITLDPPAILISDKEVTPEEAYEVYVQHGLHKLRAMVPKILLDQLIGRRARITRKPKKDVPTF